MCRFVALRKAFSSSASFLRCSMSYWGPDLRCVNASTFLVSISPSRFKAPNSAFLRLRLATVLRTLASSARSAGLTTLAVSGAGARRRSLVIGAENRRLATPRAHLADLAQPQLIRQPGSPLGQLHRGLLSRRQADGSGEEFLPGPILAGMLVMGQTGNALLLHRGQKDRTVSFPVEHHGEAMKARIVLELLLAGLVRHILFKPRNQIAVHDLPQSPGDGVAYDKA